MLESLSENCTDTNSNKYLIGCLEIQKSNLGDNCDSGNCNEWKIEKYYSLDERMNDSEYIRSGDTIFLINNNCPELNSDKYLTGCTDQPNYVEVYNTTFSYENNSNKWKIYKKDGNDGDIIEKDSHIKLKSLSNYCTNDDNYLSSCNGNYYNLNENVLIKIDMNKNNSLWKITTKNV